MFIKIEHYLLDDLLSEYHNSKRSYNMLKNCSFTNEEAKVRKEEQNTVRTHICQEYIFRYPKADICFLANNLSSKVT